MTKPTLMVLAAGMGSRYGGMKQIDPVGPGGETIMDYSIFDALRAGFGKVVFVIRQDMETAFRQTMGDKFARHVAVECVFQEMDKMLGAYTRPPQRTKPWGTTHAVLMAGETIREPFAVINADDYYGPQGFKMLAGHLNAGGGDYAMVGYVLRKTLSEFGTVARGVCQVSAQGYMQRIVERKAIAPKGNGAEDTEADGTRVPLTGDEPVSMNFWGFTTEIFPQLKEYFAQFLEEHHADLKAECYLPEAVNVLVGRGTARVKVLRSTDAWFGVTYREDRPRVVESIAKLVEAGLYPHRLWSE
ncbi:MAG TPA: sugar phosphate nucleotidyltransferase [Terracidiphilus sp.]|nr:sugar phosphate nucleotidyltransferase [Terracidiphilus sp.]